MAVHVPNNATQSMLVDITIRDLAEDFPFGLLAKTGIGLFALFAKAGLISSSLFTVRSFSRFTNGMPSCALAPDRRFDQIHRRKIDNPFPLSYYIFIKDRVHCKWFLMLIFPDWRNRRKGRRRAALGAAPPPALPRRQVRLGSAEIPAQFVIIPALYDTLTAVLLAGITI